MFILLLFVLEQFSGTHYIVQMYQIRYQFSGNEQHAVYAKRQPLLRVHCDLLL